MGEKRVNEYQEAFRRILRAVRCEDESLTLSEEDVQILLELHLSHESFTEAQRQQICEEATYVFATKEPRDRLNARRLQNVNVPGNPVARIKAQTRTLKGVTVSNNSHYDLDRQPSQVLLCRGARVALTGINLNPLIGLYHGSMGVVRDIVYDESKSPHTGDFPVYVLVEFFQYCGVPFIPEFPLYVPITTQKIQCNKKCCYRTYLPLTLAYGKTAHTFQGQNVGPVPAGRPKNAIPEIICDPGTRRFEGFHCGLFYTCFGVYVVCGCSGKNDSSPSSGWPHPAMYKSENTIYGSMAIDIKDNKLEGKFITSTGSIYNLMTHLFKITDTTRWIAA